MKKHLTITKVFLFTIIIQIIFLLVRFFSVEDGNFYTYIFYSNFLFTFTGTLIFYFVHKNTNHNKKLIYAKNIPLLIYHILFVFFLKFQINIISNDLMPVFLKLIIIVQFILIVSSFIIIISNLFNNNKLKSLNKYIYLFFFGLSFLYLLKITFYKMYDDIFELSLYALMGFYWFNNIPNIEEVEKSNKIKTHIILNVLQIIPLIIIFQQKHYIIDFSWGYYYYSLIILSTLPYVFNLKISYFFRTFLYSFIMIANFAPIADNSSMYLTPKGFVTFIFFILILLDFVISQKIIVDYDDEKVLQLEP